MLKFRCPHCNANLKVDEQLAGKQSHCPSCRATLTIPTEGSQNEPMLGAKVERISQSTLPTPSTVSTSETPGIIRRRRFRVLLTTVAASLAALVLGWSLLTTIQSRNALANLSQRVNELETAVADSDKTSSAELRKEVDKLRLRTKELQDKLEQADAAFEAVGEQKREIQASNERLVLLSQQLALLKETVDENREDAVKKSDLLAEFKQQLQAEVQKQVERPNAEVPKDDEDLAAEPGEKPMEQREVEVTVTAKTLLADYAKNELAAHLKYRNKVLMVEGVVAGTSIVLGSPQLRLRGEGELEVLCNFADNFAEKLSKLWKGQSVKVKGECSGMNIFGNVGLEHCTIVPR